MCGACEEGYSILLGDNKCERCKNTSIWLVLVPVLSAFLVFLVVSLLGISIDKGWTNMLILFGNIVFPFAFYNEATLAQYLLVPARWISLDLGIGVCLYDGMTPLAKAAIKFSTPFLWYVLMGLFTILCRCSTFVSTNFFPSKTLVTVTILSYSKVIQTCVEVLAPLRVKNLEGAFINESLRWLIDPNVAYFKGWHGVLASFSIVVAIVFLSIPFLLLSPTLAYKYAYRCKPFLDAFWAPFKPKYRIWASIRIMLRILIVMFVNLVYFFPHGIHGLVLNIAVLTFFLYLQTLLQPFNSRVINIFDNLLVLIALFVHYYGYLIVYRHIDISKASTFQYLYIFFFMGVAYSVLFSTFLWYSWSSTKRIFFFFSRCCRKKRYPLLDVQKEQSVQVRPSHSSVTVVPESSYRRESVYQQGPHRNFTRLRESLFEPEESMQEIAS